MMPTRILVADDDAVIRCSIESLLRKWGYEPVVATNGDEAWELLQRKDSPRLALLDWMMPGMTGPTLCRSVRNLSAVPYTYLILLTGKDSKEDMVSGLEAGADDYLTKPCNAYELKARLGTGERILGLQQELIAARDALKEQATHDPLTGLWNHGATIDILRNELSRVYRQGAPLTVTMADLDHFKRVNDTSGHLAGDEVLREVARRLRAAVRAYDSVGRYGGEEFLVVSPGCATSAGVCQAERLRLVVSRKPISFQGTEISITMSLGVATLDKGTKGGVEQVLGAADRALYNAKLGGRNRFEVASVVPCPSSDEPQGPSTDGTPSPGSGPSQ
jgi:diguanylate cyclase (GGDEF)-like protein